EWRFLRKFSPYQRLRERPDYPQTLIMSSTRDDRVHPGHARKMAAKLAEMRKPVAYYETTEGGHAAAVDNEQRAFMWTLSMEFLWDALDPPEE
ncbi:MAG: S9 family peptidase, partial [Pseudomonadales bacterium]|nr:S9 family peptidase [Pseudomonadales bacterium]